MWLGVFENVLERKEVIGEGDSFDEIKLLQAHICFM